MVSREGGTSSVQRWNIKFPRSKISGARSAFDETESEWTMTGTISTQSVHASNLAVPIKITPGIVSSRFFVIHIPKFVSSTSHFATKQLRLPLQSLRAETFT